MTPLLLMTIYLSIPPVLITVPPPVHIFYLASLDFLLPSHINQHATAHTISSLHPPALALPSITFLPASLAPSLHAHVTSHPSSHIAHSDLVTIPIPISDLSCFHHHNYSMYMCIMFTVCFRSCSPGFSFAIASYIPSHPSHRLPSASLIRLNTLNATLRLFNLRHHYPPDVRSPLSSPYLFPLCATCGTYGYCFTLFYGFFFLHILYTSRYIFPSYALLS